MNPIWNRPKHIFNNARSSGETVPGASPDDFKIYVSYKTNMSGQCFGLLKVIRKTDNRLLFPFTGAPELGPFPIKEDALNAAQELGWRIVSDDIANPET